MIFNKISSSNLIFYPTKNCLFSLEENKKINRFPKEERKLPLSVISAENTYICIFYFYIYLVSEIPILKCKHNNL